MADADVRWLQRLENYERALATLERALDLAASRPLSELEQQGLIQAFEFTHELSGLLLKDFLVDQGVSGISGSRDAVRQAVVRELVPGGTENSWMAMIRSNPHVQKVVLYGLRPLGRQRAGSDIDICLVAPSMALRE